MDRVTEVSYYSTDLARACPDDERITAATERSRAGPLSGGRRGAEVDAEGEDAVFDGGGGVAQHGEVLEVQLRLFHVALAGLAFERRQAPFTHRVGAVLEPLDHRLYIQSVAHGGTVPAMTQVATATPTSDLGRAKADLAEMGYCLLENALSPEKVRAIRSRIVELAEAEEADGTDYIYEGGANQRVWTLLNKGDEFADLALDPAVTDLMNHLLGFGFLLSNIDANIAGPGGKPMFLHADQSFAPPPWPPWPMVANAMWMLDDFTAENGATRVRPGSHLKSEGPVPTLDDSATLPVTGSAGTVMVFDGRLWHQTGANVTNGERRHGILAYYCRPFVRTQENWFLSIDPAVLDRRPELRPLLGYELYLSLGMVDGMPREGPRF